jgi:hypothetical protein
MTDRAIGVEDVDLFAEVIHVAGFSIGGKEIPRKFDQLATFVASLDNHAVVTPFTTRV